MNYTLLLEKISDMQGLGLGWEDIPVLVETDIASYWLAHIIYEDDENLVIIVPGKNGEEYAKILNKNTILAINVIYAQMLEKPTPIKEDGMYD